MTAKQFKIDGRHSVNRKQQCNFKIGVRCSQLQTLKTAARLILGDTASVNAWIRSDRNLITSSRWTYSAWDTPSDKQAVFFKSQEDVDKVLAYYALLRK